MHSSNFTLAPPLFAFDLFFWFLRLRIHAKAYIAFYAISLWIFVFKAENNKQEHLEKVKRK